jgi:mycobactin peptide synthetase MbtE
MQTIHGCFRECARSRPATVAVRQGNQSMTYAALDTWSDRIAGCLHERGVRPGDMIPVLLDRSGRPRRRPDLTGAERFGGT